MTTTINKEYALRFLCASLLFAAIAGWFFYDGKWGYPRENARVAPVAAQLAKERRTPADWMNTAKTGHAPLHVAFQKAGMKNAPSKYADTFTSEIGIQSDKANSIEFAQLVLSQPIHSPSDIQSQFLSAAIALAAAFLLLGIVCYRYATRITLDAGILTITQGKRARAYPLADLQAIDDAQWTKRGIFKATFKQGKVTLDRWHHAGITPIVDTIRTSLKDA